jgi:hypothetical protein
VAYVAQCCSRPYVALGNHFAFARALIQFRHMLRSQSTDRSRLTKNQSGLGSDSICSKVKSVCFRSSCNLYLYRLATAFMIMEIDGPNQGGVLSVPRQPLLR